MLQTNYEGDESAFPDKLCFGLSDLAQDTIHYNSAPKYIKVPT